MEMNEILFSKNESGIAEITFNRPQAFNALTWNMEKSLTEYIEECSNDDNVRTVIITGAGKHFCAGGDIKAFKKRIDNHEALPDNGIVYVAKAARAIRMCNKPVIAKVNGSAVGAGSAIAFACDFRVLEKKSKLGAGFVNMGFSGDTNGWYNLSRMIGMARTTEFYMLGETISADEAFTLGIANRVAEDGCLDDVTYELAYKLANSPTKAISYQKKMFNIIAYPDMELLEELERNYMPACSMTKDHAEAVNAFLEKREPKFTGK